MQFAMLISGDNAPTPAPRVPAVPAVCAGLWCETERDLLTPDQAAIRAALPARLRRYVANREHLTIWHCDGSRVLANGRCKGPLPYMEINNAKGARVATVYFAPVSEARP